MPGAYEIGVNVILMHPSGPRVKAYIEEYAVRKGMPYHEYINTHVGFMAALLALNKVSGMRVYDVEEEEAFDESAIAARRNGPDFILDDQTHIFFRQGGYEDTSPEGLKYLEMLGGVRKDMVPGSLGIKEMTKETWEKEIFWESDTDVTFLNTLAFADIFGGKDFFSTEDCLDAAAMVNEKYPGRVLSLGTLEPNKPNAIERLEYSVKELKMDGLKLYPWDHSSKRGWFADDEKEIYPLWEKCRELGVNKIHMHKGLPVEWAMAQYVHPSDVDKPLIDFPDLTFVLYHAGYPYIDEMASLNKALGARHNLYVDVGAMFAFQVGTPVALAHCMGKLVKALTASHICWGTDAPISGPPQWQIEAFRKLTMPEELIGGFGYPQITDADKELMFGRNMAGLYGLDVDKLKKQIKSDKLSKAKAAAR